MGTIWFGISFLLLYSSIICLRKSEKAQNIFEWCVMTVIVVLCYQAFATAILNLCNISIDLYSVGFTNIVLGAGIWCRIYRKHQWQEYYCRKRDFVAVFLMLIPIIFVALHQFGPGLNINYASVDGVTHFRLALKVIQQKKVSSMFLSPLNNALMLELFMPFVKETQLYHVFVLLDILLCFLGGITFYCVIANKMHTRGKWILGVGVSILYMLGYPRNSLLYGFNYLGMSVVLILFLVWILQYYLTDDADKRIFLVLLSLGCYSVGICYSLFAPVVFCSVCAAVSVDIWVRRKDSWTWLKKFLVDNLKIFLIPCLLVFLYSFVNFFMSGSSGTAISDGVVKASNDIALEGAIYRDLFSNFVFWMPFVLFGIYEMIKHRVNNLMLYYALFLFIFILGLGYGGMKLKVSSYYYYKNYFFLAAVLFYLACWGILALWEENRQFILASALVYTALGTATVFNVEVDIQKRNLLFSPTNKSGYYFDIYTVNHQMTEDLTDYPKEKLQLIEYFGDTFPANTVDNIIVCARMSDVNIFCAITQRLDKSDFIYWYDLSEEEMQYYDNFTEKDKRLILMKDGKIDFEAYYAAMQESPKLEKDMPFIYFYDTEEERKDLMELKGDDFDILYKNEFGFVAIMKNCIE